MGVRGGGFEKEGPGDPCREGAVCDSGSLAGYSGQAGPDLIVPAQAAEARWVGDWHLLNGTGRSAHRWKLCASEVAYCDTLEAYTRLRCAVMTAHASMHSRRTISRSS